MYQILFAVNSAEVLNLNVARELLVASGADEILKVYGAIEADGLAAVGALYLIVLFILKVLALPIAAVALAADAGLKALAGVAVAVALAIVAILTVALACAAFVAIAVTVVITAIASIFLKVKNELLNLTEVVIKLLNVIVEGIDLIVNVIKLLAKLGGKLDESRYKLALCGALVKVKAVCKALDICCFFIKCHFYYLLYVENIFENRARAHMSSDAISFNVLTQ